MGSGHDHGISTIRHEEPLRWALLLTVLFLIAEVLGAFWTHSLALLSDAAHMSTDALALLISLLSVRMSRRPPDAKRTFGYVRVESMGAMANGLMLFAVGAYILYEAIGRFRNPPEVASTSMLVIAVIGLIVNLISMRLLKAGSGESLNMKGAYLEVWSDMLGSVAVIAGAAVIQWIGWRIVDPILAVLIALWVLPRTWTLVRQAGNILMMGVPEDVNFDEVKATLLGTKGVKSLHDLHVWALASNQPSLTAHLVVEQKGETDTVRTAVTHLLHERFHIEHVTLQVEAEQECAAEREKRLH